MNGILVVDKPAGWTSHDVVAKLRNTLRNTEQHSMPRNSYDRKEKDTRVGHGGTLDPMATGVLPVFIGRATRAAGFCENADKEYIAGLKLGLVTDTQDTTGIILESCDAAVSANDLLTVIPGFLGAQDQIPPMYSAIKVGGKKLYELARGGADVPRSARNVFISEITLLGGELNEFLLRVVCSKGTYVRTLCHDIGAALGCGGAMSSLRRTRAGVFTIDAAYTLDGILETILSGRTESIIRPVDSIFSGYQPVMLSKADMRKCKNGAPCQADNIADGMYRFYGPDNEFIALGEARSGRLKVIKGFYEV